MERSRLKFADLDQRHLEKVQSLEEQMGSTILVMEQYHPVADLSDQQLAQIKSLEQELNLVLVAYRR